MDLAEPYYGSNLAIYMDNFYSGVELFQDMKSKSLDACGTIRANRKGLPRDHKLTKKSHLGKHEFRVAQKDDLTFCIWQDTKAVMVLSNFHDPTLSGTVQRRKGTTSQSSVVVPACLADYQKHMKGLFFLTKINTVYEHNCQNR